MLASLTTMLWNAPSKSWTGGMPRDWGCENWKRYFKAKRHLPALRAALTAHRAKAKTNAPIASSRAPHNLTPVGRTPRHRHRAGHRRARFMPAVKATIARPKTRESFARLGASSASSGRRNTLKAWTVPSGGSARPPRPGPWATGRLGSPAEPRAAALWGRRLAAIGTIPVPGSLVWPRMPSGACCRDASAAPQDHWAPSLWPQLISAPRHLARHLRRAARPRRTAGRRAAARPQANRAG